MRHAWDADALFTAPETYEAPGFVEDDLEPLFFAGLPYKGRPTRVFAWLGLPKPAQAAPVPGVVLVHGGGGTAFPDWVRLWNDRGYAAIAIDTCGCVTGGNHNDRPRHAHAGPRGWGGFDQLDRKPEDQWMHHAVAAAVLGHSLLASRAEVDERRIGMTGISWGGVITCNVVGVDQRLQWAAPVYGCGFFESDSLLVRNSLDKLPPQQRAKWRMRWDPKQRLGQARLPMLWFNGTNDFAFTPDSWQRSYRLPRGPRRLSLQIDYPHGQEEGARPEEVRAFADHHAFGRPDLPHVLEQGLNDDTAWARFSQPVALRSAELVWTGDDWRAWPDRRWKTREAVIEPDGSVHASIPRKAGVLFFNVTDERGLVVSSEHVCLTPRAEQIEED